MPYGELVVTDQVQTAKGARPKQPKDMLLIRPRKNLYAVFPGHLYHGVIGRMWRPLKPTTMRMTMAVNWWTEQPKAEYLHDSRECMKVLRLEASSRQRAYSIRPDSSSARRSTRSAAVLPPRAPAPPPGFDGRR